MKLKKAFTLTELLVALAVVGVLTAVLFPIIYNLMPDQNIMMAKRAYYSLQQGVADLINDEACYPDLSYSSNTSERRYGFDNSQEYETCEEYSTTPSTGSIPGYVYKFGKLLSTRLDVSDGESCNLGDSNAYTFVTKDGVCWSLTAKDSSSSYSADNNKILIKMDLNAADDPNCYGSSADTTTACTSRTSGFDRLSVVLRADGKMTIQENWAKAAVKVNKKITGD